MSALSNVISTYQQGVGYPFIEPKRTVPTGDDQKTPYDQPPFKFDVNGNVIDTPPTNNGLGALPTTYQRKTVRVLTVDMTSKFNDFLVSEPGSLIFVSGQFGGTAAPFQVRLDNFQNDRMTLVFDRAVSGIPFKQFYLTNLTAQPGVSVEITIVSDSPFDRVGLNG